MSRIDGNDGRQIFSDVLRHELDACDECEAPLQYPTMIAGWQEGPMIQIWWLIETFVQDPVMQSRLKVAMHAVREVFKELAAESGTAVDEALVLRIQKRIMWAWFPTGREVVSEAKFGRPQRAAQQLLKRIEVERWRQRSV